jgi:Frag1/DRAM/Sfk1 family
MALLGAVISRISLILLSIFNNFHFTVIYDKLVIVFIAENLISVATLVLKYILIVRRYNYSSKFKRTVKVSFIIKLSYLVLKIITAIAFVIEKTLRKNINLAAVLEYVNAVLFAFFIFSFIIDLANAPFDGYYSVYGSTG